MLKIDCDKKTAALKEAIRGSICSEATWLQKVDHNDSECGLDEQSGCSQRGGMGCGAKEQYWARLLGAVSMLVLLAPLPWAQLSLAAACARVIACIPPGSSRTLWVDGRLRAGT